MTKLSITPSRLRSTLLGLVLSPALVGSAACDSSDGEVPAEGPGASTGAGEELPVSTTGSASGSPGDADDSSDSGGLPQGTGPAASGGPSSTTDAGEESGTTGGEGETTGGPPPECETDCAAEGRYARIVHTCGAAGGREVRLQLVLEPAACEDALDGERVELLFPVVDGEGSVPEAFPPGAYECSGEGVEGRICQYFDEAGVQHPVTAGVVSLGDDRSSGGFAVSVEGMNELAGTYEVTAECDAAVGC